MEDFNKYTSHINYSPIVDFVLQQGKRFYYKKGDYFSRQGETCRTMGFVTNGSFRYCCTNNEGESRIVGYTFDHSFVGNYPAFQLQDKSNVDIQALCDCSVYVIDYRQMADFYETNDAHQKLGRRIAETLLWEVYDPDDFNIQPDTGRALSRHYHPLSRFAETDYAKRTGFLSFDSPRNIKPYPKKNRTPIKS